MNIRSIVLLLALSAWMLGACSQHEDPTRSHEMSKPVHEGTFDVFEQTPSR